MTDQKKKPDPLAALRLRGQIERERRVDAAQTAAQDALTGARRALGEMLSRCGEVEEARARLAEAEAVVARVTTPEQKARLEERLANIRKTLEESETVCKRGSAKR